MYLCQTQRTKMLLSPWKTKKNDEQLSTSKNNLGFVLMISIKQSGWKKKWSNLLQTLHQWWATRATGGIPFSNFEFTVTKLRLDLIILPVTKGLLSPHNKLIAKQPAADYIHYKKLQLLAISNVWRLLVKSIKQPTQCKVLILGSLGYISIADTCHHGVDGVIIEENSTCMSIVFW